MNVTRFPWLRRLLASTPATDKIRVHLRSFHSDVLLSFVSRLLSRPFSLGPTSAMVIAPHQDDETFGCGGLIALKCRQGVRVQIVFLTNGAYAPLPEDGSLGQHQMVDARIVEARAAAHILGVPETGLHFLGLADQSLSALAGTERDAVVNRLHELISANDPAEIYIPHRMDGHRDHEAAYTLVLDAVARSAKSRRLLQYLIWRPWLQPILFPSALGEMCSSFRLPIESVMEAKVRAIAAYVSQLATLPGGFLARFHRPYELFLPVKGNASPRPES